MDIEFKQARYLREGDVFLANGEEYLVRYVSTNDMYRKQITEVGTGEYTNGKWTENIHTYLSRDTVQVIQSFAGVDWIIEWNKEESK